MPKKTEKMYVSSALQKLTPEELEAMQNFFVEQAMSQQRFTQKDDQELITLVRTFGCDWKTIAKKVRFCAKECQERWNQFLSPSVSNRPWTQEEDELLKKLVEERGSRWAEISKYFHQRTNTNVKNRWVSIMRNRATKNPSTPPKLPENIDIDVFGSKEIELPSNLELDCDTSFLF